MEIFFTGGLQSKIVMAKNLSHKIRCLKQALVLFTVQMYRSVWCRSGRTFGVVSNGKLNDMNHRCCVIEKRVNQINQIWLNYWTIPTNNPFGKCVFLKRRILRNERNRPHKKERDARGVSGGLFNIHTKGCWRKAIGRHENIQFKAIEWNFLFSLKFEALKIFQSGILIPFSLIVKFVYYVEKIWETEFQVKDHFFGRTNLIFIPSFCHVNFCWIEKNNCRFVITVHQWSYSSCFLFGHTIEQ